MRAIATMGGLKLKKGKNFSDYEAFDMLLSLRETDEYGFKSQNINGDIVEIHGISKNRGRAQPVTIEMKKTSGKWLIHSMGSIGN
ncbi:hypothetical protein ACTRXD_01355 [Nitrospira sp. T9]|uniref:hypothetical protein n=1 Tax=unclassified Nitrospira TaxID=2652172 RepID=UPI003F9A9315